MSVPNFRYEHIYRVSLYYKKKIEWQFDLIDFSAHIQRNGLNNEGEFGGEIEIYNLSQDHRGELESIIAKSSVNLDGEQTTSIQIKVEVGYVYGSNALQMLTYDDISNIYNTNSNADRVTHFKMGSGLDTKLKKYYRADYEPGESAKNIITDLAIAMVDKDSITSYYINPNINDRTFSSGYSFVGNLWRELVDVCNISNNICHVENGKLYVSPAGTVASGQSKMYILIPDDGLLVPPRIGQANYHKKYTKGYMTTAYEMQSVLIPELRVNDLIRVNNTIYTVKCIDHSLNTLRNEFYTLIGGLRNK